MDETKFKLEKEIDCLTITKMFQETELKGLRALTNPLKLGKKISKENNFPELENKFFAWFCRNESKQAVLTDDVVTQKAKTMLAN